MLHFLFPFLAGLSCIVYPYESLVGRISFRVQKIDVRVETKTLDNVFITAIVSVQYQVQKDNVYDAFYSLTNPRQQITAHIYDVMRSELPNLELDAVFDAKEELAVVNFYVSLSDPDKKRKSGR